MGLNVAKCNLGKVMPTPKWPAVLSPSLHDLLPGAYCLPCGFWVNECADPLFGCLYLANLCRLQFYPLCPFSLLGIGKFGFRWVCSTKLTILSPREQNTYYHKNLCISHIFLSKYWAQKCGCETKTIAFRGGKLAGMGSQITLKTIFFDRPLQHSPLCARK